MRHLLSCLTPSLLVGCLKRLRTHGRWSLGIEDFGFFVREKPRARDKTHAFRRLEREAVTATGRYVDDKLRVGEILKRGGADIEGTTFDRAQKHVVLANAEIALFEAHG